MVPPKLYKIGEVMRYSGLSRQTVHNYTVMGLVSEAERTPSGHRLYDGGVFARLARIRDLKERLTLQEIKRLLDDEGDKDDKDDKDGEDGDAGAEGEREEVGTGA